MENMKTRITEMLGIEYPIIQGGMAWVAEHHLAAAVSEAGGLGLIGGANAPGRGCPGRDPQGKRADKEAFWRKCYAVKPSCG